MSAQLSRAGSGAVTGDKQERCWWTKLPSATAVAIIATCMVHFPVSAQGVGQSSPAAPEQASQNIKIYDLAVKLAKEHFYDAELIDRKLSEVGERFRGEATAATDLNQLYRVINRMLLEVGSSHSIATPARRAGGERPTGGFLVERFGESYAVTDVVPGGPAAEAGVKRGWLWIAINDVPVSQLSRLGTVRASEPQKFTFLDASDNEHHVYVQSRVLANRDIYVSSLSGGITYIDLRKFDGATTSALREALKGNPAAAGIVLDLRRNPGGSGVELEFSIGSFFSRPVDAGYQVNRSGRRKKLEGFMWRSARNAVPMVILTSQGTASAAEIFAHVLRHHGRAVLIGQKTAGAVLTPEFFPLLDTGTMSIPVARYIGLDGEMLEGRGVTPDIEVGMATLESLRAGRDLELEAALEHLRAQR